MPLQVQGMREQFGTQMNRLGHRRSIGDAGDQFGRRVRHPVRLVQVRLTDLIWDGGDLMHRR